MIHRARETWDVAVVGGGIVGLATATALAEAGCSVVVLEKEARVAAHQTGRNSGVVHSGVYYAPGSDKAVLCREGAQRMRAFCMAEELPYREVGKVIVATNDVELERLGSIAERAKQNGVAHERVEGPAIREIEPHVEGLAALWVPQAAVADYGAVARRLAEGLDARPDCAVRTGALVSKAARDGAGWRLVAGAESVLARRVVNCAGLHSDRVARLFGRSPSVRIVPFRGEYWALVPSARHLCRGLIYPVPDPSLPFLGVHFTVTTDGGVLCGPNAVLALAREGYGWRDVDAVEALSTICAPSFARFAARHVAVGAAEVWRSLFSSSFVRSLRRLVPAVERAHLVRAPSGVRAQAMDAHGGLVDDFRLERDEGVVHVLNAPSPAATSSLAIGARIARALLD